MARGEQLGRQWRIIQSLLAARTGRSAAELADEVDCHRRTLYRDLEALQVAGFPLFTEQAEGRSRWHLLEPARQTIPIPLNLSELMALYFSRDLLIQHQGPLLGEAFESLFEKIKSTLPPDYLGYLRQLSRTLAVGAKPAVHDPLVGKRLEQLRQAIHQGVCVHMRYLAVQRKKPIERTVAPYRIWFFEGIFYLIGHCQLREEVRIFALERMQALSLTEQTFSVPDEFDVNQWMQSSFGVFQGEPQTVRIHFNAKVAPYIRARKWHASQKIEDAGDGGIYFEARVAGIEEIKFWVLRWGAHARVLVPAQLKRALHKEAKAMLAAHAPDEKEMST